MNDDTQTVVGSLCRALDEVARETRTYAFDPFYRGPLSFRGARLRRWPCNHSLLLSRGRPRFHADARIAFVPFRLDPREDRSIMPRNARVLLTWG